MKIVILAINSKYIHSSLSAWLLARSLSCDSHEIRVVEANINQDYTNIAESVCAHKPGKVLISTYIWNAAILPRVIAKIRGLLPNITIILGGPEAAHNRRFWLENGADEVDTGQVDFIDPYTPECLAALAGRIAYIETSRGCPFSCAFCLSGSEAVRFVHIDAVYEQLHKLAQSQAKMVKLTDRTFNCNPSRANEIFRFVIGLDTDKCFHFEVAADLFDDSTLALLASAPPGRIQLEIGIQSFCEAALQAVNRVTDLVKAEKNIKTLLSAGNIHVHVDLIAGLPHETLTEFIRSFNRAYEFKAHHLQLGFLKMLHGSRIRNEYDSILFIDKPPYEITSSPWLSEADLRLLKTVENNLNRTYNKARFVKSIEHLLKISRIDPFSLYSQIGTTADEIYRFGGGADLLECLIIDWLASFKGENLPDFMRICDSRKHNQIRQLAQGHLGRKIARNEAAVLPTGGAYVDSKSRDPVTGLYKVVFIPFSEL
jgi:radical SAM superfamily enzyme YgiQ (UPF0313 family)